MKTTVGTKAGNKKKKTINSGKQNRALFTSRILVREELNIISFSFRSSENRIKG